MRIKVAWGILLLTSAVAQGEEPTWAQCEQPAEVGYLPAESSNAETALEVDADEVVLERADVSSFTGNVEMRQNGQTLTTEHATYNKTTGEIIADGNVTIRDSDIILEAEQGAWSLKADGGSLDNATYYMRETRGRGEAAHIDREGDHRTDLSEATYTTCPEGSSAWQLSADNVSLDHESAVGVARNVVVKVGNWPVLYTPYMSFPLDDERKSGFLSPSIGNSNKTGFDLSTPYYWNIAPDRDATITPRWMSDRGLMLQGQFRYLFSANYGQFDAAYLASDNQSADGRDENPYHNEDRKQFSWQHNGRLASRWTSYVDYNYVSDKDYLEDFGNTLSFASTTHLNRQLQLGYGGQHWRFTGNLQGYQSLTNVIDPYQRLPQLLLLGHYPNQAMGLNYDLRAEYVDFDHDEKVTGQRIDIEPAISLPLTAAAGFIKPRIALRHTRYELDDLALGGLTSAQKSPTRTLPILSVDSGLFFERDMMWRGRGFIQTLEPRVYYLYIPERDQSDIPLFDTNERTFNMGQLFTQNRFVGGDRVGDANQLSIGLTTRFIDEDNGKERLRVSAGQIRHFEDRKVNLRGEAINGESDSDMVVEVAAAISDAWALRGEVQWDPSGGHGSNMETVQLRYRGDNGRLLNLSHRYRRDELEQIDASVSLPITDNWRFVGRWYHSLFDDRTLEALAGIEYESCCWATRFVVRDYIHDVTEQDRNLAFFVQLELKGLGDIGNKADDLLRKSILGYGLDPQAYRR